MTKPPRAHKFPRTPEIKALFLKEQLAWRNNRKRKRKNGDSTTTAWMARPLAKLPGTFNVSNPDGYNPERHLDHLCSWKYAQVCLEKAPKLYLLAHRLTGQTDHGREVFSWLASFPEGEDILVELVEERIECGEAYNLRLMNRWLADVATKLFSHKLNSIIMFGDVHIGHIYKYQERRIHMT